MAVALPVNSNYSKGMSPGSLQTREWHENLNWITQVWIWSGLLGFTL